jgi:hypothetical protein
MQVAFCVIFTDPQDVKYPAIDSRGVLGESGFEIVDSILTSRTQRTAETPNQLKLHRTHVLRFHPYPLLFPYRPSRVSNSITLKFCN